MSTNAGGEASYDAAIDDFLGESGEEEVEAPEPKKEQPDKKAPAKTAAKPKPAPKPKEGETDSDTESEDESSDSPKPKDGPWKAELAKRGIDTPEVNQYMQEVIQPYVTRLEQQGGPIAAMFEGDEQAAGIAAGLLNDLGENPAQAIADLITLLDVDDEAINAALDAAGIDTDGEEQPQQFDRTEDEEVEETPEQKWVRERMEREEQESQAEAYDNFMKTLADEFGPGFDETLFSMALAAAGDIEGAMEMYPALQEQYGKPAPKAAPPVMGRRSPGQSPQPAQKTYDGSNTGWESAMDDFFSEEKAKKGR